MKAFSRKENFLALENYRMKAGLAAKSCRSVNSNPSPGPNVDVTGDVGSLLILLTMNLE